MPSVAPSSSPSLVPSSSPSLSTAPSYIVTIEDNFETAISGGEDLQLLTEPQIKAFEAALESIANENDQRIRTEAIVTGQRIEALDPNQRALAEGGTKFLKIDYTIKATGTDTTEVKDLLSDVPRTVTNDYEKVQKDLESQGVAARTVCNTDFTGDLPENPLLTAQLPFRLTARL